MKMDDAMRTAFARQGYMVVPDVLNQQELDELNQVYDQHVLEREETLSTASTDKQNRFYIGGRDKSVTTDRHGNTYMGRRFWSKAYMDLIDNQTMLPIMEEILGDPSWGHAPAHMPAELRPLFRLDHDNVHYKPGRNPTDGADKGGGLHGGPSSFHITCVYELKTVGPNDGGFGCVVGTHKQANEQKLMDIDEWELLLTRTGDDRLTFLVSTHWVSMARTRFDRLLGIREGRVVIDRPAADVDDALLDALYEGSRERR